MNPNELAKYLTRPLNDEEISLFYRTNDIKYEKCLLFKDFSESLILLIHSTYMGDDVTCTKEEKQNHFLWCYKKNVENFKKESISFKDNGGLKWMFFEYIFDSFYEESDKDKALKKMTRYWVDLFSYKGVKTRSDIDSLTETYKIFERDLLVQ